MGLFISKMLANIFGNQEAKIVMVGLDAAGKSTILYKLNLGEVVHTIPTVGFNVETITYKNIAFTVWDIGGQHRIRKLWRHYYQGCHGVIFVVDASDVERLEEARDELAVVVNDEELRDAVVLVYANKMDLPQALSTAEIVDRMELHKLRCKEWFVQATIGVRGDGLYEGLEWLSRAITANKRR